MYELMNSKEIMTDLAQKIKTKRISLDYTQEAFALKSGVALSTYRTFENSGKGSFENFVAIMTALGSIGELDKLLPKAPFSPADTFQKKTKKIWLRVTKKASNPTNNNEEKASTLLQAIKAKNAKS